MGKTHPHVPISADGAIRCSCVNQILSHLQTLSGVGLTGILLVFFCFCALCLGGCTPTVNLATPDPVKVDVNVRLDVYQKTAPTQEKEQQSSLEIAKDRRQRSGEIQGLKNNGLIGEDRDGYIASLKTPDDPKYAQYAKKVIDDENADRSFLYLSNAQSQNKPLEMLEREYAQLWSDRAFPGEWVQKDNGKWTQK